MHLFSKSFDIGNGRDGLLACESQRQLALACQPDQRPTDLFTSVPWRGQEWTGFPWASGVVVSAPKSRAR